MIFATLAIGLIVYLIASSQMTWAKIPSVLATTANAFGIVLVIVFLGHGLVSLPKQTLLYSAYQKLVASKYKEAELVDIRRYDMDFVLEVKLRRVRRVKEMQSGRKAPGEQLSAHCDTILSLIPQEIVKQTGKDSKAFDRE